VETPAHSKPANLLQASPTAPAVVPGPEPEPATIPRFSDFKSPIVSLLTER
jgi:hypothetical protein